jgi:hypothetical protein
MEFPVQSQLIGLRQQAKSLKLQFSMNLPITKVWQHCFRLPEIHQQMGLPQERQEFQRHPLGFVLIESELWKKPLRFWEFPLYWEYLQYFRLERLGLQKEVRYLAWEFNFKAVDKSTQLEIALSCVLAPTASSWVAQLKAYLQKLKQTLETSQPLKMGQQIPFSALYNAPLLQPILEPFAQAMNQASLYRQGIHPRALENASELPREQILRACLQLSHQKELKPVWWLHEPDGTLHSQITPEQLPLKTNSHKYGKDYDLLPDYHLSLWFNNSNSSEFYYSPFPADQNYRVAQFWLWKGDSFELCLKRPGAYRLASPTLSGHIHLRVGAKGVAQIEVQAKSNLEDREWPVLAAGGTVRLECLAEIGALFYCYTPYENQGLMTAAQAICSQELAVIFPECKPPHGAQWKVGQQVFLLLGLLNPDSQNQNNFQSLVEKIIWEYAGAKIQASSDTYLLAFPWAESALRASLQLLKEVQNWNALHPSKSHLQIQIALHRGGAIVSNQNHEINLSGPGLRLGMHLLAQAKANEAVFSRTLMLDPAFQNILAQQSAYSLHEEHVFIRANSSEPDRIYRLVLLESANHST